MYKDILNANYEYLALLFLGIEVERSSINGKDLLSSAVNLLFFRPRCNHTLLSVRSCNFTLLIRASGDFL